MEGNLNYEVRTKKVPRKRRWYTRLWRCCLCCSCRKPPEENKFVLYRIGYDPIGPLQQAAGVGDLDTLQRLIHSNEHHVDECDRRNRTSIHYACAHNHPEAVILLLENESNINIQDDEGSTPLIKATQQENVDCVSVLLAHDADANLIDATGNTAFHHAVSRGNIPITQMLLEHDVDFEAKNRFGITPIELADFNNKREMVQFLETYYENARMLNRISKKRREKRRLSHVRFNRGEFVVKHQRSSSCEGSPPEQLKSILKTPSHDDTDSPPSLKASEKITRTTPVRHPDKPSSSAAVRGSPAEIDPTAPTTAADTGAPAEMVPTAPTTAANSGAPADMDPTVPTSAPVSGAPADMDPTVHTMAADIGAPAAIHPTASQCPNEHAELNEKRDSETASDTGPDFIIDLSIYREHARDTPHADPEPIPTSSSYYSIDSTESTDRNLLSLLKAEDKSESLSSDDEFTLVPDIDEYGAPAEMDPTAPTTAADSGAPADMDPTVPTSAPVSGTPADMDPTVHTTATDIGAPGAIHPTASQSPTEHAELNEKHDSETASDTGPDFIIDLSIYREHARDTPHADTEPIPTSSSCYSIDSTESTDGNLLSLLKAEDKSESLSSDDEFTLVPDIDEYEAPAEMDPSVPTTAADTGAPADMDPTVPTSAPVSGAPADMDPTVHTMAADIGAPAAIHPTASKCPTEHAELNEKRDSETASDTGPDFIIDLSIYREHARDTPHADPEPIPTSSSYYSIDSTESTDRNLLSLLKAEDESESLSSDDEFTLVPDIDEYVAPSQDAEIFFDASESVDHTEHRRPNMLRLQSRPFIWFQTLMFSMMTWMRTRGRQVWHESNGTNRGPPTNRNDEPVAAAADQYTLDYGARMDC
ncbi:uncharacterized protein LOC117721352 [Arvicanthis niloticus]|uniref:uncharacterized protein LOC117721352 n=1 Tax=Arvicanthis niloticus TaxID=61156 RepID=UPI00402B4880